MCPSDLCLPYARSVFCEYCMLELMWCYLLGVSVDVHAPSMPTINVCMNLNYRMMCSCPFANKTWFCSLAMLDASSHLVRSDYNKSTCRYALFFMTLFIIGLV